jgi:diacylglycerol O-acyltransferase
VTVERLTDEDVRILARERGEVRGHMCKVLVVDGEHDADELRARVGPRLARVPRLSDCLVEAPLGLAPPAWLPSERFALDRQIRDGPRAATWAQLEQAVAALMEERLDRDRPLWSIDVVALDEGRSAIVLRLHHCMADGAAAMHIVGALLLDHDEREPAATANGDGESPSPAPATGPRHAALLLDALRWRAAWVVRGARGRGGPAPHGARRRSERLAAVRRNLAWEGRPSPLARPAGPRRVVAFSSFALDEVKAIAHGAPERATVNDVVLAAVAGGLRRWLAHVGADAHDLRVKVPVSLHHQGEVDEANRDSLMVVHLPLDEPDPVAHDADELDAFFNDLGRFSRSLERLAERWAMSPRVFALNVSNVPGPQGKLTVMGSRLCGMYSIAEIAERHLLRVAVVSAGGRLSFGLCADADAVERLDLVTNGIAEELRALRLALAPA